MAKVFIGQTALQIRLNLNQDLRNNVKRVIIKYRKPNGILGFWNAEIIDAIRGIVAFTLDPNAGGLDDSGYWTFWGFIYYLDGSVTPGDPIQIGVYQQGKQYIAFPYGQTSSIGEEILMAQEAFEVIYDNSISHLAATNVQDAVDEVKADIEAVVAPDASHVPYNNTSSGLPGTNVQMAIDELDNTQDLLVALLGQTNKTLYVDGNRTDSYAVTGSIQQPFKTISAAAAIAINGNLIRVAAGTYLENISLPDNVSFCGMGIGQTILNGNLTTGLSNCSLKSFTVSGALTIRAKTRVDDVLSLGAVIISDDVQAFNFDVQTALGPSLTLSSGTVILDTGNISTSDASSAVVQNGGNLTLNMYSVINNSVANAAVYSTTGVIRLINTSVKNNGTGQSIQITNFATMYNPNILSEVFYLGNIDIGTSYTLKEGVYPLGAGPYTLTGANFMRRPAEQIFYDNSTSHMIAANVQAAIDESHTFTVDLDQHAGPISGAIYVEPAAPSLTQEGTLRNPFGTIAQAVAIATANDIIYLQTGTYVENVVLPDGVSIKGTGEGISVITGNLTTGTFITTICFITDLTVGGNLNVQGLTEIEDVRIDGLTTINSNLKCHDAEFAPTTGQAILIHSGATVLDSCDATTTDGSKVIVQDGGDFLFHLGNITNNSATNAAVESTGGTIELFQDVVKNTGGGLAIRLNNGAAIGQPNRLSIVFQQGGIDATTAYTLLEGVTPISITGTNILYRRANQISYDPSATGLTAVLAQSAIDEAYGSCKKGTADPTYTPARTPEFFFRTDNNQLFVYNGTGWVKVQLAT